MKNLVIIRTCKRDDFLAFYCYQSFKKVGVRADFIFFAEYPVPPYKWIEKTKEQIIYRNYAGNFGGILGAMPYITDLKRLNIDDYDRVVISDSDIIVHKDPFYDDSFLFGGIRDDNNPRHFSGQFQIYDAQLLKKIIEYPNYLNLSANLQLEGINIADDTMISHVATQYTDKTKNFFGLGYWTHDKLYSLENEYSG